MDSNKSVAALAIVTSMKTEGEVGVDKLLRQLPSLMPELPDEHKIVIVDSVRELVAKYRHKHQAVINALSGLMRDGGYEFKKTLVETILFIMKEVPESKESALTQLCEFIEDCEFPGMTARIIHLLGTEGPRTLNPSRYIRHIYNRIILESPQVRASAVQALTKFGVLLPELKPRIVSLLKRCLIDNDDEVRDRATLCLHLLQQEDAKALKLILPEVDVPLVNLKRALVQYIEQHAQSKQVAPFDVSTVSREQIVEKKEKKENKAVPDNVAQKQLLSIQQANAAVSVDVVQQKNEELEAKIEAFQRQFKVGALSHTSKSTDLTEAETEFVVSCVKHFFAKHVLFQASTLINIIDVASTRLTPLSQFNVRNTLNDQVIDNVSVEMVPDEDAEGFKYVFNSNGCLTRVILTHRAGSKQCSKLHEWAVVRHVQCGSCCTDPAVQCPSPPRSTTHSSSPPRTTMPRAVKWMTAACPISIRLKTRRFPSPITSRAPMSKSLQRAGRNWARNTSAPRPSHCPTPSHCKVRTRRECIETRSSLLLALYSPFDCPHRCCEGYSGLLGHDTAREERSGAGQAYQARHVPRR